MRNLTLLFSLVILLVACGEKDKTKSDSKPKIEALKLDGLKIAYYSNDSIKEYFEYYKREDAAVTKKQKAFQAEIDKRTSELQNYVQRKDQEARSGLLSQNEIGMAQQKAQQMSRLLADIFHLNQEQLQLGQVIAYLLPNRHPRERKSNQQYLLDQWTL